MPFWPFRRGRDPITERGAPATLGATPTPELTENPNPVKNTETGDYILTFLDPATKHIQFTLELSLLKADGSLAIGPLTQKNGIFNLGQLENGEYQWALSRVNTVKNKKTSTRNGKFTISDTLPPVVNPPEGTEPGTTPLPPEETAPGTTRASSMNAAQDMFLEALEETKKLEEIHAIIREENDEINNILKSPVDEKNLNIRVNSLQTHLHKLSKLIDADSGMLQGLIRDYESHEIGATLEKLSSQEAPLTKKDIEAAFKSSTSTGALKEKNEEAYSEIVSAKNEFVTIAKDFKAKLTGAKKAAKVITKKDMKKNLKDLNIMLESNKDYLRNITQIIERIQGNQTVSGINYVQAQLQELIKEHDNSADIERIRNFREEMDATLETLRNFEQELTTLEQNLKKAAVNFKTKNNEYAKKAKKELGNLETS